MAVVIYFDHQNRGTASFGRVQDPNTHHIRFSLPDPMRDPDAALAADDLRLMAAAPRRARGSA
jgi:hypothetical protein